MVITDKQMKYRVAIFKALAHPTRLTVIQALADGEKCVCELTELIKADTSTVSRHLAQLRSAGLIMDDKRGLQVFYKISCPCLLDFLQCVDSFEAKHEAASCCERSCK
jgi:ArsR family transcriptional regulator